MTYVLQMVQDPPVHVSVDLIRSLHFLMTHDDLKNRPGRWRAGAIYVRKEETGEIVYEGADVDDVPALMADMVEDVNRACSDPALVRAAMAHLNLAMIHPFRDGNGRMARCLQSLILASNGTLAPVFMSVEEYLGRNTQSYYDILAEVGAGSWAPARDARPWVRFILTAHLRQARTLQRRVKESARLWEEIERIVTSAALPERVIDILSDAAMGLRIRNATYRAMAAQIDEEISEQTASRDLRQLVGAGLLIAHGEKRGRYYARSRQLLALRQQIIDSRDPQDMSDPFVD